MKWSEEHILDAESQQCGEPHFALLCLLYGGAGMMLETANEWTRQIREYGRINGVGNKAKSLNMVENTIMHLEEHRQMIAQIEADL